MVGFACSANAARMARLSIALTREEVRGAGDRLFERRVAEIQAAADVEVVGSVAGGLDLIAAVDADARQPAGLLVAAQDDGVGRTRVGHGCLSVRRVKGAAPCTPAGDLVVMSG